AAGLCPALQGSRCRVRGGQPALGHRVPHVADRHPTRTGRNVACRPGRRPGGRPPRPRRAACRHGGGGVRRVRARELPHQPVGLLLRCGGSGRRDRRGRTAGGAGAGRRLDGHRPGRFRDPDPGRPGGWPPDRGRSGSHRRVGGSRRGTGCRPRGLLVPDRREDPRRGTAGGPVEGANGRRL
ncbi:uncharacterized protein METZ01_LOCUS155409, partial [marine metagenome]